MARGQKKLEDLAAVERSNKYMLGDAHHEYVEAYATELNVDGNVALHMLLDTAINRREALAKWSDKQPKKEPKPKKEKPAKAPKEPKPKKEKPAKAAPKDKPAKKTASAKSAGKKAAKKPLAKGKKKATGSKKKKARPGEEIEIIRGADVPVASQHDSDYPKVGHDGEDEDSIGADEQE